MSVRARRPIFVGGSGRSGTTLVGQLLGGHPDHVTVPELPFKLDLERLAGPAGIPGRAARALLDRSWKFRVLELDDALEPEHVYADARAVVEALVAALAARAGRPDATVWIDHTPTNLLVGWRLAAAWPEAGFVHVIRDGRAVAASVLDRDWGPNDVLGAAATWSRDVAAGLAFETMAFEAGREDRVARVRYEDLVASPEPVLRDLCARLGLAYDPGMAAGGAFRRPRYIGESHGLLGRPPDPGRAEAWRSRLSPAEVRAFEHAVQGLLPHLGYLLDHPAGARRPGPLWRAKTRIRAVAKRVTSDWIARRRKRRRRGFVE